MRQHHDPELAAALRDLTAAVRDQVEQQRAANQANPLGKAARIVSDLILGKPRT